MRKPRIGVFVCHCGLNIAGVVDVERLAEESRGIPGVVFSKDYIYMCSEPGQDMVEQTIKEEKLDGIVVANCSPSLHEKTFRNVAKRAGLNPFKVEVANIREQVSWPHENEKEQATRKALTVVRETVKKLAGDLELEPFQIPVTHAALVIGGGVAGIQAALDIADAGHDVYLVERTPTVGGNMLKLSETFPTLDCPQCIMTPKMTEAAQHPHIHILAYSEVEEVSGYIGNFEVKIRHRSPYIDWSKCNGCADCAEVCPVVMKSEWDHGMDTRRAAYRPFDQAVPNKFTIDKQGEPPCRAACPVHLNAHGYVTATSAKEYGQALSLIRNEARFPFAGVAGRICTHPCQDACSRQEVDSNSVAIKHIKRWLADWELREKGEASMEIEIESPSGQKVAIVGAGPGGLQAAVDLRKNGHEVIIFDAQDKPGGMLRAGIPAFRLDKDVLQKECELVFKLGVDYKPNTQIGMDIPLKKLIEDYDAVYLCVGAYKEGKMGIPGEELDGVSGGVQFLGELNRGKTPKLGKRVAVVGGGNSAMDTARSALRLGSEVTIIYRRTEKEMPAISDEIHAAKEEGIKFMLLTNPTKFIGEGGKLKSVEVIHMKLGEPDSSGRRRPIPIEGSEEILEFDNVFLAVGEKPDLSFITEADNIELTEWGTIAVDEETLVTSNPKVFSGGDCVTGPATFIDAAGAGRKAARSINLMLEGLDFTRDRANELSRKSDLVGDKDLAKPTPLSPMPELAIKDRITNFNEVELGYSEEEIVSQAQRCIHCGGCSECRLCEAVCEPDCIEHSLADWTEELEVGAIIVATGYELMPLSQMPEYGGGKFKHVIDAMQFERILCPSGPTAGEVRRPADGKVPKKVAFVHCAGSRDPEHGVAYCSRVCCMYLVKQAMLYKHAVEDGEPYLFYIDIRTNGKRYEEFYARTMEESHATFIRGKVSRLYEHDGKVTVFSEDTLAGQPIQMEADLVVVAPAMIPSKGTAELASRLRLATDEYGWVSEAHPKLRAIETLTGGIFVAGAIQFPKDITDTVCQASGAAGKVLAMFSRETLEREPLIAEVDQDICTGCGVCEEVCPYDASVVDPVKKKAKVNEALCEGCGACAAACPSQAVKLRNATRTQLFAMIEEATRDY
ncbi:FAD-dependent oxidoreductase [candidate division WOR-3 bacterium]|nr:FAD-dependent oxidoreductase [candidate division WOR-3 bacterium]